MATTTATTPPSLTDIRALKYISSTVSVASPAEIEAITKTWAETFKIPNDVLPLACWDLARAFADVGASSKSELTGDSAALAGVSRKQLAQAIKIHCTIRQFCMYFANIVWNIMLDTKTPPASWSKLGYKEESKFAGFDFFDGVNHPAALMPADGLIRGPSDTEILAHQTAKQVALHRDAKRRGTNVVNSVEITNGRSDPIAPLITYPQ
uniref:Capsid protein n=1 Tax=White clover mosaic virus TaxID=12188 RepID=Q0PPT5_9VIRU|nr:capsid protein [White clover mosaic virus]